MYINFPYLVTLSSIQFWEILLSNKLSIFAYEKKKKKGYVLMSPKQVVVVLFFSKKPLMFFLNKKQKKGLNVLRYANLPVKVGL